MDTLTRPDDSFTVSSFNPCGEVNRRFSFLRSQEVLKTGQTSYEGFSVDQPVSLKRKNVATMVDVYSRVTNDAPRRPLSSTFTNFRDFRVQDNSRPDRYVGSVVGLVELLNCIFFCHTCCICWRAYQTSPDLIFCISVRLSEQENLAQQSRSLAECDRLCGLSQGFFDCITQTVHNSTFTFLMQIACACRIRDTSW